MSIEDNGRGIPVDIHSKTKKPAVETIFTTLHAGGKFGGENSGYKMSGGLHGVGSSVVNALSDFVEVTVWKNKKEYLIKFENGGNKISNLKIVGTTNKKGTRVLFKPMEKVFSTINLNGNTIAIRLKELAYLNPDLNILFKDQKNEQDYEFSYPNGVTSWIDELAEKQKEISKAYKFSSKNNKITLKIT